MVQRANGIDETSTSRPAGIFLLRVAECRESEYHFQDAICFLPHASFHSEFAV